MPTYRTCRIFDGRAALCPLSRVAVNARPVFIIAPHCSRAPRAYVFAGQDFLTPLPSRKIIEDVCARIGLFLCILFKCRYVAFITRQLINNRCHVVATLVHAHALETWDKNIY